MSSARRTSLRLPLNKVAIYLGSLVGAPASGKHRGEPSELAELGERQAMLFDMIVPRIHGSRFSRNHCCALASDTAADKPRSQACGISTFSSRAFRNSDSGNMTFVARLRARACSAEVSEFGTISSARISTRPMSEAGLPAGGFEPPRLSAMDFKSSASTIPPGGRAPSIAHPPVDVQCGPLWIGGPAAHVASAHQQE